MNVHRGCGAERGLIAARAFGCRHLAGLLCFFLIFAFVVLGRAVAQEWVQDSAKAISAANQQRITTICNELRLKTGFDLVLATAASSAGLPISRVAEQLAKARAKVTAKETGTTVIVVVPALARWGLYDTDDLDPALPRPALDRIAAGAARTRDADEMSLYLVSNVAALLAKSQNVALTSVAASRGTKDEAEPAGARRNSSPAQLHDQNAGTTHFSFFWLAAAWLAFLSSLYLYQLGWPPFVVGILILMGVLMLFAPGFSSLGSIHHPLFWVAAGLLAFFYAARLYRGGTPRLMAIVIASLSVVIMIAPAFSLSAGASMRREEWIAIAKFALFMAVIVVLVVGFVRQSYQKGRI